MSISFVSANGIGVSDGGATSVTYSNITVSTTNGCIVAAVTNSDGSPADCTGVTIGGNAMTGKGSNRILSGGFWNQGRAWVLPIGAGLSSANLVASFAAAQGERVLTWAVYSGVDQTTPTGTAVQNDDTTAAGSVTNSSIGAVSGADYIIDCVALGSNPAGGFSISPGSSQTERIDVSSTPDAYDTSAIADKIAGSSSESRTYNASSTAHSGLGMISFALKEAASGQNISHTGLSSAAVYGSHSIIKTIEMTGKSSAAVFGSHTVSVTLESISPSGLASAAVFGSHTVSTAAQVISPSGKSSAAVFGSHTVALANQQVQPGGKSSAAVYGSHEVIKTPLAIGVSSAAVYGTHSVSTQKTLSPSGLSSAAVYGSHSIQKDVALNGISSGAVFGTANVAKDKTLTFNGLASAAVYGTPVVNVGNAQGISLSGLSSAAVFGSHSVIRISPPIQNFGSLTGVRYGAHTIIGGAVTDDAPGHWQLMWKESWKDGYDK